MANRKRDVQILLWVTPEEKKMIRKRMILSKTSNMSVYLRKMAIDGMIVNTDTTYLKAMYQEMHKIGVNINQLLPVKYLLHYEANLLRLSYESGIHNSCSHGNTS